MLLIYQSTKKLSTKTKSSAKVLSQSHKNKWKKTFKWNLVIGEDFPISVSIWVRFMKKRRKRSIEKQMFSENWLQMGENSIRCMTAINHQNLKLLTLTRGTLSKSKTNLTNQTKFLIGWTQKSQKRKAMSKGMLGRMILITLKQKNGWSIIQTKFTRSIKLLLINLKSWIKSQKAKSPAPHKAIPVWQEVR